MTSMKRFWALAGLVLITGCGKDLKLSVKAAEQEKDQPTAALVRKVELTYHNPAGHEEMRESLPVLGLSQPVSARSDLLRGIHVENQGVFEARGYTSDGLLMLRGWTHPDESGDVVQIEMNREESQRLALGAPLLRRVRVTGVSGLHDLAREARDFHPGAGPRSEDCVALPSIPINMGSGIYPRLILEGAIKAPQFKFEASVRLEKGGLQILAGFHPVSINPNGDAEIELGQKFLNGLLFKGPSRFILRIHSQQYEGCLDVSTRPELIPVKSVFLLERGVGSAVWPRHLLPVANLVLSNPNDVAVVADVEGTVTNATGALGPCTSRSNDAASFEQLRCGSVISEIIRIEPRSSAGVALFGALDRERRVINTKLRLSWTVISRSETFSDGELANASSFSNEVP